MGNLTAPSIPLTLTSEGQGPRGFWTELRTWPARRWLFAVGTAVATILFIAIPTALIPNPIFGREIPPTAWAWPVLVATSTLSGMVAATYVARKDSGQQERGGTLGTVGALTTFFAVGCPVCNKLVLVALGYTGALQFFAPIQPFLAFGAVALLAAALIMRVRREGTCPVPAIR